MAANHSSDHVNSLDYYYPDITREQANERLKEHLNKDGLFLLRISSAGTYAITVVSEGKTLSFKISVTNSNLYYLDKEPLFKSVRQLVEFYKNNDVPLTNSRLRIRLSTPFNRGHTPESYYEEPVTPSKTPPSLSKSVSSGIGLSAQSLFGFNGIPPSPNSSLGSLNGRRQCRCSGACSCPTPVRSKRPPMPIPKNVRRHEHIYVEPRDPNYDMSKKLIKNLEDSEKLYCCSCGLSKMDSILIGGWAVHRSSQPEMYGRLYFVNESKNELSWNLPEEIESRLPTEMKNRLTRLRES